MHRRPICSPAVLPLIIVVVVLLLIDILEAAYILMDEIREGY